ncbi:origin recognition complex subunit 5-like protein [Endogone sp. FLAS-F59071]|nr:origin recognition complex subunit 5-like protein [Endogone sp. FLAS-F59071]|eukprot:RUS17862.1 origin recognition complex subunit 5-like protein [Endogone sp. FLAS-F59071]
MSISATKDDTPTLKPLPPSWVLHVRFLGAIIHDRWLPFLRDVFGNDSTCAGDEAVVHEIMGELVPFLERFSSRHRIDPSHRRFDVCKTRPFLSLDLTYNMEEPTLQQILEQEYPGRSHQIQTLIRLMGKPTDPTVPAIFVYGHTSSGKTSVLRSLFKSALPLHHFALVNCVECHTPRLIFEHALNQLTDTVPGHANGYRGYARCDTLGDFVVKLGEVCDIAEGVGETRYLILDRAERLRDMSPTLIPVLLRLRELTSKNICVILVSTIVWDKFRAKTGAYEPLLVRFSDYSKNILARYCPSSEDLPFFLGFVEIVYDIFQRNCKDLNELRHLVSLLFPRYLQPVLDGIAQRSESAKLFKLAQPYFVEATDKLYLREISSAEWAKRSSSSSTSATEASTVVNTRADFDLPYYTKFLLIAAFLASYNPPRLDVRYFAKVGEEKGKRRKGGGAKRGRVDKTGGKMRQQLLGPKAFPVERMLAIFYSIIDEPIDNTVDIHMQIASLITLRLLTRITTADRLDSVKCKCNVSHEFIRQVARGVRFEVDRYLFDFV